MDLDLRQVDRFANDLGKAAGQVPKQSQAVVASSARDVVSIARALAPVRTGRTRSSISATIKGSFADIGPTTDQSKYLEYGTSRMAPRPFMGPALDAAEPGYMSGIQALVDRLL